MTMPNMPQGMTLPKQAAVSTRTCMTASQLTAPGPSMFSGNKDANCTSQDFSMSGGRLQGTLQCEVAGTTQRMTMDGQFTPTSYVVNQRIESTINGMATEQEVPRHVAPRRRLSGLIPTGIAAQVATARLPRAVRVDGMDHRADCPCDPIATQSPGLDGESGISKKGEVMKRLVLLAPLALLACSGSSTTIQPGQWEMTTRFTTVEAPGMPPAALQAMQTQAGEPHASSTCITPETGGQPRRRHHEGWGRWRGVPGQGARTFAAAISRST
jgi:hypothetical protein